MNKREALNALLAQRAQASQAVARLADLAIAEKRALTDAEATEQRTAESDVTALDARITELDAQVRADESAAEMAKRYAPAAGDGVRSEPEIYTRSAGSPSYFRDMWLMQKRGDRDAIDRLVRNNTARGAETRAISTTDGAGGEFVPPKWLVDEYVKLARPGRISADRVPTSELPSGTDSISVPKVATGTATAQQTTQNTAITPVDLTTTSVSSPIITIAGGQVLSLQLIEQSPLNVDDMVLSDLAAAYAVNLNTEVLSGSGAAGHITGILTLSGTNAITATSATPDAKTLYAAVAQAISQVHGNRFLPPDAIVMHPRRWNWLLSQSDSQGRPLVVPNAQAPMNSLASQGAIASEGYVGTMLGLPVYVDALIPTNVNTNQDPVIVARFADLRLYEGNVKAEAFAQTYANQLSVFVRLYNYASFQPARYPKSISIITGTELAAPLGF